MGNTAINIILLAANLFCAGILFLCMHRKYGSSAYAGRAVPFTENVAGILEFSVYGAGMIRIADLILQGIASPGRADGALFAVRVLLTESMLLLFPLWKLLGRWKREESLQGAGTDWDRGGVPGQAYGKRGGSRFREQVCGECGNKPGYEAWNEESIACTWAFGERANISWACFCFCG